jgi:hypothetical protein
MKTVYSFVDSILELPDKVLILQNTMWKIFNHTAVCMDYVHDHLRHRFGGIVSLDRHKNALICDVMSRRLLRGIFSDKGAKIDALSNKLRDLGLEFDRSMSVNAAFGIPRVHGDTGFLSKSSTHFS